MEADITTSKELYEKMLDNKDILEFKYGFTIPFVIGAYHRKNILSDNDLKTEKCLQYLLDVIYKTSQKDNELCILACGSYKKLVLQYITNDRCEQNVQQLKRGNPHIDQLIYLDMYVFDKKGFNNEYTLKKVIDKLWEMYKEPISAHKFSYNNDDMQWTEFTQVELKFIDELN